MRLVKRSARCEQFLIHSGLSNDCTSDIASTTATLICCSLFCSFWVTLVPLPSFRSTSSFSKMFIKALLHVDEQRGIVPSAVNIDLGTRENSYVLTASWLSISSWLLQTSIILANRFLSSCSSTKLLSAPSLTFSLLSSEWEALFLHWVPEIGFLSWIHSLTKLWKIFCPMVLCLQRSFLMFSGITTFVTRLNKSSLSWLNGLATLYIVVNNCSDLLFTGKHRRCESMMARHRRCGRTAYHTCILLS